MKRRDTDDIIIREALTEAAYENGHWNGQRVKHLNNQQIAKRAGDKPRAARLGEMLAESNPKSPTFTEVITLAKALGVSPEEFADRKLGVYPSSAQGVSWRMSGVPRSLRARACRVAARHALELADVDAVQAAVQVVYAHHGQQPLPLDERAVRGMVQSALELGLVRFEPLPDEGDEADEADPAPLEEPQLAGELAQALARDPLASATSAKQQPQVRVVKNVTHESFSFDPVAPYLVARVGHDIIAKHLELYRTIYEIGMAGGMHCATLARTTGAESSPFPDDSGDKRLTFVPLTLEPFTNHQLPIADSVVGQMVAQAGSLLGPQRVEGLTLQSFGYLIGGERFVPLDDSAISQVRQHYRELDIAIFGCGDLESDGWLERVTRRVKTDAAVRPATDVCLNLLDLDGSQIPLPDDRHFVGISLDDIRRLVRHDDKLALLLTSGSAKGRPIVVASRAGCVDTIVCDRAAAEAALDFLSHG